MFLKRKKLLFIILLFSFFTFLSLNDIGDKAKYKNSSDTRGSFFVKQAKADVLATGSVNTGFTVQKNTTTTGAAINAHGICKVVKNSSATKDYFVPTKTATEWNTFLANAPAIPDISLAECAECTSGTCCDIANGRYVASGTTCRPSAGPCDVAETCTGVSAACPTDSYRTSAYICDTCSAAGSSGACQINDTGYKCTGTSAACGVTNPYTCPQNAPTNNNVWTSSAWSAATYTNRCNLGSYTCSGNTVIRAYYGCNTSGSCNTIAAGNYTAATCTGGENSRCVPGQSSCQNLCGDGLDNDGDGFIDNTDEDCNALACEQCNPSDPCCDSNGCFLSSATTCRASAGVCDVEEKCTGISGACPTNTYRNNTNICDTCSASGSAGACQINDTGYKCSGTTATCGTTNPYTCPQNAPTNNNVWTSSAWSAATYTNRCNLGSYTCSGNNIVRAYYGCNTSGGCNSTAAGYYTSASCTGGENSRCVPGQTTCQNQCSDGIDNDGDGYIDNLDTNCNPSACQQCNPADPCCDSNGCFLSSATTCRASGGVCDVEEKCTGVSGACPTNTYRNNAYICDACSADGSAGSCQINDTGYKCSGSSATCGTTNPYTCPQNAPTNNNVWTASSWASASSSNNCNLGSYSCSGNSIIRAYFGCNTSGGCNSIAAGNFTIANCGGGENSRCVAGQSTCQNLCSDGLDNDGDGLIDNLDPDCNVAACGDCNPADPCCDSNGCYISAGTVCRASAGVCDVADTCTGTSSTCDNEYRPSTYVCSTCTTSGSSGSCQLSGTGYRCTGSSATCGTTNPYSCTTNAPTTNNVWNGSSWAAASSTNRCNLGSYFCSGNTIKRYYYGCTTSGTCSTTAAGSYNITTCGGGENSQCINGQSSCQSRCSDGIDNDGDGYIDAADTDCGGCGECNPALACCSSSGCYLPAGTGVGTCQKCTGSSGSPVNQTSSEDILGQCSTGSEGSSTSCRSNTCSGTGAYCGYLNSANSCRTPVGPCDKIEMCTGSSYSCPSNSYYTTAQQCDTLSSCSGAGNSCSPTQSVQYCSGSSSSCTGSISSKSCPAPVYPRVWYGGGWQYTNTSFKCGTTSPHTCSGQQPQGYAKGCNTFGSCGYTSSTLVNVGSACAGTEASWCVNGSCVNRCSNGIDDDGNGYTDGQDTNCGGCGDCTSGPCCDVATGCYKNTSTKCYSGSCSGLYLSGTDNTCTYSYSDRYCSGGSAQCDGYIPASSGNCNCPPGSQWNSTTKSCDANSSTNYCGLGSYTSCSGTSVTREALWCGDIGDCTVPSGYYKTSLTCSGSTPYCSGGNCVGCASASNCGTDHWEESTCYCSSFRVYCQKRVYTCNSGTCGSYLTASQQANACFENQYCMANGDSSCYNQSCSAGYTPITPGGGCTCCPAGYKCPTGVKDYCDGGTYNSSTCRTTCTTCEAGYYCSGGTSRTSCPAGKWSNPGATTVYDCYDVGDTCSPGYWYDAENWCDGTMCYPFKCVHCTAGEYCPGDGNRYCCAKGTYSGNGASSCTSCPAGQTTTYTCTTTSTGCVSDGCPAGQYMYNGQCYCCPKGRYSSAGATSCTYCPTGHTTSSTCSTSSGQCTACPKGTYLSNGNCVCCPKGKYQPYTGRTSCYSCSSGYTTSGTCSQSSSSCYYVGT